MINRVPNGLALTAALLTLICLAPLPASSTDYDVSAKTSTDQKAFQDKTPLYGSGNRLLGHGFAIGDFSGDGVDDIIVGSPLSETSGASPSLWSKEGAALYQKGPITSAGNEYYDLAVVPTGTQGCRIFGRYKNDRVGFAAAFGAINASTGAKDLVLASSGTGGTGEVYVFFGGQANLNQADIGWDPTYLYLNEATDFSDVDILVTGITGAGFDGADTTGIALATGDFNGDGLDDIAIGAPHYNSNAGAVFLVYGQSVGATLSAGTLNASTIIRIDGPANSRLGSALAFANVCGPDAKKDLIIGAKGTASQAGRVYVVKGTATLGNCGGDNVITVATETAYLGTTITGPAANDEFGAAVAGANVDGTTGYDDILVGCPRAAAAAGEVYVFYGAASLTASLAAASANVRIVAPTTAERFGAALHAADFSGDGLADLVVGAPDGKNFAANATAGRAYMLYGGTTLPATIDLAVPANLNAAYVFYGEYPGGRFGSAIGSGLLAGRTSRDLFVAAETGAGDSQGSETGCLYQIYYVRGPNAPTGVTALATPSKLALQTVAWTHSDPESLPQTQFQVQFAKDAAFTVGIVDSGSQSGTGASYGSTLNQGDGTYYYRVRTANQYNWGAWSANQTVVLDTTVPVIAEFTTWNGLTHVNSASRTVTLRATDGFSAASTLSVILWRSRQATEDLDVDGVCDSGEGAATTLTTGDAQGGTRDFSLTFSDVAVPANETVRIWVAGADVAGNAYAAKILFSDPVVQYTLKSALGPLATAFNPPVPAPDLTYLTTTRPTIEVTLTDDDAAINTASVVFRFSNTTVAVGLVESSPLYAQILTARSVKLIYSSYNDGIIYSSNGTYTAELLKGPDANANPLQNPTLWQFVIDNNPPNTVNETGGLNGTDQSIVATRTLPFVVLDNIRNTGTLTANYWRGTLDDTDADGLIDGGEVKTTSLVTPTATGTSNTYTLTLAESGMKTGDTVAVWITGSDYAGNAIDPLIGGSLAAPRVLYHVHTIQGPTVKNWTPTPPRYFNTAKPAFSVTLTDDDAGVDATSVILSVSSADYTVSSGLTWGVVGLDTTFNFVSPVNLPEGTVDVWLKQAKDVFGNAIDNAQTTKVVHFVDLTGPLASVGTEFPARNASTSNTQTDVRFTLGDALAGVDINNVQLTIAYKDAVGSASVVCGIAGTTNPKADPRLTYAAGVLKFTPGVTDPNPFFNDGPVTITLSQCLDRAGNPLQTAFSWNFNINTTGPIASNLYPVGTITSNRQHEIRCTISSVGDTINTASIQLKINNTVYYVPSAMLSYDTTSTLLTFNPLAGGAIYPDGTVAVQLLAADDLSGRKLQNAPVSWQFVVDTTGPTVINRVGTGYERKPAAGIWVTTGRPVLKLPFADAPTGSGFNYNTLNFRVNGQLPGYAYNSLGVTTSTSALSATENGYLVTFDPTTAGVTFADGTVQVAVTEFKDLAGNSLAAGTTAVWTFYIDSAPPQVTAFAPTGYVTNGLQPISCTLADATSGLDTTSIVLTVNGDVVASTFNPATGLLSYTPSGAWADGSVSVEVYVKDKAGAVVADPGRYHAFYVDKTRPIVTGGETPANLSTVSATTPDVSILVWDGGSGIDPNPGRVTMTVRNSQSVLLAGSALYNAGDGRVHWTPSGALPEGTIAVSLTDLYDKAGWNLATSSAWTFFIDVSAPVAKDIRPVTGELVPIRTREVELTLTDNMSGIDASSIRLTVNGTVYTIGPNLTYTPATGKLRFIPPAPFVDGPNSAILTQAADNRGYGYVSSPYPLRTDFTIDGAPPTAAFTSPTGTITSSAPIEASLTDVGSGLDLATVYLVVASEANGRLYATGIAGSVLVLSGGTLTFSPAAAGISYPDDTISVSLVASDLVGNQLNGGTGVFHTFLHDSRGPVIVVSPADTRIPGPNTKPYVNATTEVIQFRLVDRPSGVDWSSLVLTVATRNTLGTVVTNTLLASPLSSHLVIDPATGLVTYTPGPDQLYPSVSQVTVTVTQAKDRSPLAIGIDPASPDRTWTFEVNSSYTVASDPQPPNGGLVNDRMAPLGLAIANEGGIDPATIVLKVGGTTREVGVFATHTLAFDAASGRLTYTPTLATRYDEGTVAVTLDHARDLSTGLADLPAPYAWNVVVDSLAPTASPAFPLAGQYINDNRTTIAIALADAGTGIQTAGADRILLRIKRATDADFIDYLIGTSPYVAYDGATLTFNATHTYLFPEGETRVRLERAKDRAGNQYAGYPLDYRFSINTQAPTIVSHAPVAGAVSTNGLVPVVFTFDVGLGSAGVDAASLRLGLKNNAAATVEVTLADPRLAWTTAENRLVFTPAGPFAEGSIQVTLLTMRDREGHDYTASSVPYSFNFLVDATPPTVDAAGVTPKSPAYAVSGTQPIQIPVNDGIYGSGIDLASVRLDLSYNGSGGTFSVGIGDNLAYADGKLVFTPTVAYREGTAHVFIAAMRDRAGLEFSPRPYGFEFPVDLAPPALEDATREPADGAATTVTRPAIRVRVTDTSAGLDLSTLRFTVRGTEYKIDSPGVAYDPATGYLSYAPAVALPEGTTTVVVTQLSDRAGFVAAGSPSGVAVPAYAWSFCVDNSNPAAANPIPQAGSYKDDPNLMIYVQITDTVSGIGTYSVTLLDSTAAPIACATSHNRSTGVLTIDPAGPLPSGLLTVRVQAFDRAGNGLPAGEYAWQFHLVTTGPVVTLVEPAAGARIKDNLSTVRWQVADSGAVQASTIRLTLLDGAGVTSIYTTASGSLVFADPNLTFDPKTTAYPDGTVTVTLEMRNNLNKPISGASTWAFVVDTTGPRVTPAADCVPAPGGVTDRKTQEITITLKDALGPVDPATISLKLTNPGVLPTGEQSYGTGAPGLSYDAVTRKLTFNPIPQGLQFATGEVKVTLTQAKDDLGNELVARPVAWTFTVVDDQPFVVATRPTTGDYTNDPAKNLEIDLFLPQTTTLDLASAEVVLTDGAATRTLGIAGSGSPNANPGLTYNPSLKRILVVPAAATSPFTFVEGTVTVTVRNIKNSLGKVMPADHVFRFVVDRTGPLVSDGQPTGYVASAQASLSLAVADNGAPAAGRIDPASLRLHLETGTRSVDFTTASPALTYDAAASRILFNPAAAVPAFAYSEGSVAVTVAVLADRAGNPLGATVADPTGKTFSYGFTLDTLGPLATAWSPNAAFVADPDATLEVAFNATGTPIAPASLRMVIYNNALVQTINGIGPGVVADVAGARVTVRPSLAGFALTEGSVAVELLELKDVTGNSLQNPLTGTRWEWFLDASGPYVVETLPPAATTITADIQQEVGFRIADLHVPVDTATLAMTLEWWNGTVGIAGTRSIVPTTPGAGLSVGTDGVALFLFRPKLASPPITFMNGTVSAVLTVAKDAIGNGLSAATDRTVEVLVNTNGPVIGSPSPIPGTVLGSAPGTISVTLVTTIPSAAVVADSIAIRLYGVEYTAAQFPAAIRYANGALAVNPAAIPVAFRDGPVTFEVSRALDSYGNRLLPSADPLIGADNAWDFTVDLTGPAASLSDPANGAVTGAAAPVVRVRVADYWSTIDVASGRLKVANAGGEWTATMASYDAVTKFASFNLAGAGITLPAGRSDFTLSACNDVFGHPLQQPFYFSLSRDAAGPVVSNVSPADGSALRNRQTPITARIADDLSALDPATLKLGIANGTLAVTLAYPSPGLFFSSASLLFDPVAAGILFNEGTVTITFPGGPAGLKDTYGNAMAADRVFAFLVLSRGPYAASPIPADGAIVVDNQAVVSLTLRSELSTLDASSIRLSVAGVTYDLTNPALTYGSPTLRFNPSLIGLRFAEGSVVVSLIAARDLAGNGLENAPYTFAFLVDSTGPEADFGVSPADGHAVPLGLDPAAAVYSLHFGEPLVAPPTLAVTDRRGSVEVLTLDLPGVDDPLAGTTTVYLKRVALGALQPPLTFKYSATDRLGNRFTDRAIPYVLGTAEVSTGIGLPGGVYHLVSFPVLGSGTLESVVTNLATAGTYGLYELNRDTQRFAATGSLKSGLGYAFLHDRTQSVAFTLRGYHLDRPRLDFSLPLKPGWNIVAAPYPFRVHYAGFKAVHGGVTLPVADPGNTWLDRAFFGYATVDGRPGFDLAGTDSDFEAYRAYFVHARDTLELRIAPVPLTADELSRTPVPPTGLAKPAGAAGWLLKLSARTATARDDFNYFGLLDNPSALTLREPPLAVFAPYLSLFFTTDTGDDYFTSSVKDPGAVREAWTFTVSADTTGQAVTLAWPVPYELLNDKLVLTDLATNQVVDMTRVTSYAFTYGGTRDFRIVYSRGGATATVPAEDDTVAPRIVSAWPKGLDVSPFAQIRVALSEDVNAGTVTQAVTVHNEYKNRDVTGKTSYNPFLREILFLPDQPLTADDYYKVTVMSSVIDLAGNPLAEYAWYFKTAKPADAKRTFRKSYGPGWNLVSLPYFPADAAVDRVFAGIPDGYGLVRYRNGGYQVYDRLAKGSMDPVGPGLGYWLRLAATREVALEGAPADTARPYRVPLYAGDWNQFGCPFDAPVEWYKVKVDTGTSELSIASAVNGGYLLPSVYYYEGGAMRFFAAPAGSLEPGLGYFLYSNANCTLLIPAPAVAAPRRAPARRLEPASAWHVRVTLRADGTVDDDNYFGCDSVASAGYDLQDTAKLEPLPPCVVLRQPRPWGPFRAYAADFRAPFAFPADGGEERAFAFELLKSGPAYVDASLSFAFTRVPADYRLVLVDGLTGERTELADGSVVTLRSYEAVRAFSVEVEKR